jgi:glycosyltransferase 2 family protein
MSVAAPDKPAPPEELEAAVTSSRRGKVMRIASVLISLVFLGAAGWWASKQKMPELPSGATAYLELAAALGLYAFATLWRGERWHRLLHHTSIHPGRVDSYSLVTVGYAGNNILPARAGEWLRTFLLAGRVGGSKREILGTIIAERVLDAGVLAIAFAFGAYGTLISGNPYALLGIVIVGIAAVLFFPSHWRPQPSQPRLKWVFDTIARLLGPTRRLRTRTGLLLFAITLVIWAIEASTYFMVAKAVDLGVSFDGAVFIMVVANFVALIPAGPGYVGTFDAAVLFAAKSLGKSRSVALPFLLLLRFVLFIPITVTGLLLLVGRYGGLAGYRAAKLQASEA